VSNDVMPQSSASRTHAIGGLVADLAAVGHPVAVGELADLEAASAE
jgi:hypothetical protein